MERVSSGYRFAPSDLILVRDYLRRKCRGDDDPLLSHAVQTADVDTQEPWILTGAGSHYSAKMMGARYFFSTRKNRGHEGQGYWRYHDGKDERIYDGEAPVADKRAYTYIVPTNKKTHWFMDEYELVEASKTWLLCKIKNHRKVNHLGDEEDVHSKLPDYYEFPPTGYVFKPTPYEVLNYLVRKVKGLLLTSNPIENGDVYNMAPWSLTGANDPNGKYYFTRRTQLHERQRKIRIKTGDGCWVMKKKMSHNYGFINGEMGTFQYHRFIDKRTQKTNWIMHEFVVTSYDTEGQEQFREWAVCWIMNKEKGEISELPPKKPIEQVANNVDNATADGVQAPAMVGEQASAIKNATIYERDDGAFTEQAVHNSHVVLRRDNITRSSTDGVQVPAVEEEPTSKDLLKGGLPSDEETLREEELAVLGQAIDNDIAMCRQADNIRTAEMQNVPVQSQEQGCQDLSDFNKEVSDKSAQRP